MYGITSDDWKFSARCGWVHDDVQWALLPFPSQRTSNWASYRVRAAYKYKFIVRICADEWPLTRWSESFLSPTAVQHIHFIYTLVCMCVICRFVPDGVLLCHYTLHASVSMCHNLIWRVVTTNVSLSADQPQPRIFRVVWSALSRFLMGWNIPMPILHNDHFNMTSERLSLSSQCVCGDQMLIIYSSVINSHEKMCQLVI